MGSFRFLACPVLALLKLASSCLACSLSDSIVVQDSRDCEKLAAAQRFLAGLTPYCSLDEIYRTRPRELFPRRNSYGVSTVKISFAQTPLISLLWCSKQTTEIGACWCMVNGS